MMQRFVYRNGFIVEQIGEKKKLVADFHGGLIHICPQDKEHKRIIKLLNLGFERKQEDEVLH